ncbi:MAG: SDR family oxidoreductase [FCB group bacterium]|nr:SDR family oxidoreductase [FCB group bacterium]
MTKIKNKTVLITGAASGIGRQLALMMLERKATVVAWDVDAERLDNLKQDSGSDKLFTYQVDLTDRDSIYDTAEKVKAEAGLVDVLINNAGIVSGKPFLECTDEQIEATMQVNIMAHFWTVRAFLPDMLERNSGHIVTVSSAGGLIGTNKMADYSASKFAAVGFDESLRAELKQRKSKVRTTIVCPYYFDSGMFAGVKSRFPFLLPILKTNQVAKRIVMAVRHNHPRVWFLFMTYTISPLRIFPVAWFDAIANFFGVNAAMDEFKGRE